MIFKPLSTCVKTFIRSNGSWKTQKRQKKRGKKKIVSFRLCLKVLLVITIYYCFDCFRFIKYNINKMTNNVVLYARGFHSNGDA